MRFLCRFLRVVLATLISFMSLTSNLRRILAPAKCSGREKSCILIRWTKTSSSVHAKNGPISSCILAKLVGVQRHLTVRLRALSRAWMLSCLPPRGGPGLNCFAPWGQPPMDVPGDALAWRHTLCPAPPSKIQRGRGVVHSASEQVDAGNSHILPWRSTIH